MVDRKDLVFGSSTGYFGKRFLVAQPDKEVRKLSRTAREDWIIDTDTFPLFLPSHQTILTCQDKLKCAQKLGDLAPETRELLTTDDVIKTGNPAWIRAKVGAGGKDHYKFIGNWEGLKGHCSEHKDLIVSKYLPGDNWSVDTVWDKGTLLGSFTKKRISYSLTEDDNESGGSSMVSQCIKDDKVLTTAILQK